MIETDLSKFDSKSVLIFNHIPKCAGSTVNSILSTNFPHALSPGHYTFVNTIKAKQDAGRLFDAGPVIIHGHYGAGIHSLFEEDVKCFYFTILRKPISIAKSLFHFSKNQLSFNGTFEEFILGINDSVLRVFAAIPGGHPDIAHNYAHIGFTEDFDSFLRVLLDTLNLELSEYTSKNVSSKKKVDSLESYDGFLESYFKEDIDFYEMSRDMFGSVQTGRAPALNKLTSEINEDTDDYLQSERASAEPVEYKGKAASQRHYLLQKDNHDVRNISINTASNHVVHELVIKQPKEVAELLLSTPPVTNKRTCTVDSIAFYHATLAHCFHILGKNNMAMESLAEAFRSTASEPMLKTCLVKARLICPERIVSLLNLLQFKPILSANLVEELLTFPSNLLSQLSYLNEEELRSTAKVFAEKKKGLIQDCYHDSLVSFEMLNRPLLYLVLRASPINSVGSLLEHSVFSTENVLLALQQNVISGFSDYTTIPIKNGKFYCTDEVVTDFSEHIDSEKGCQTIICSRDLNYYSYNEFLKLARRLQSTQILLYPYLNVYLDSCDQFLIAIE